MACKNALCWKTRIFSSFEKAKFWSVLIWNLSLFHFKFYLKIMLNYKTFDICCRYLGKIPKILNISQDSEVYANFIFHRITPLDILHVIQWVNHFAKKKPLMTSSGSNLCETETYVKNNCNIHNFYTDELSFIS